MSSRYSFVDGKFMITASRVEEMKAVIAACKDSNWSMSFDGEGNAVSLYFPNEISDLGKEFLAAIAPFVEPGSYVQMSREGRDTDFRLVFRDGVCREVWPRLIWPGEEEG